MADRVILCVDDEPIVLNSLTKQLADHFGDAFLYELAENAEDAFDVIAELEADDLHLMVIVSDWLMPGMKGDEFLVRVHQRSPDIVKIMLTGQANRAAIERAQRDAHLHACLYKPWTEDDLIATIRSAMKH